MLCFRRGRELRLRGPPRIVSQDVGRDSCAGHRRHQPLPRAHRHHLHPAELPRLQRELGSFQVMDRLHTHRDTPSLLLAQADPSNPAHQLAVHLRDGQRPAREQGHPGHGQEGHAPHRRQDRRQRPDREGAQVGEGEEQTGSNDRGRRKST